MFSKFKLGSFLIVDGELYIARFVDFILDLLGDQFADANPPFASSTYSSVSNFTPFYSRKCNITSSSVILSSYYKLFLMTSYFFTSSLISI